jgi:hypothetical protein
MKKLILICLLLSACSTNYKPVADSFGRSGTFNEDRANNFTNDLIICQQLAKENANQVWENTKVAYNWLVRPQLLWLVDKAEYTERKIIKNCLTNRGHSILND